MGSKGTVGIQFTLLFPLLALFVLLACERTPRSRTDEPSAVQKEEALAAPAAAALASTAPTASTGPATATPSGSSAPAEKEVAHCKALGRKDYVSLGDLPGAGLKLSKEGPDIYVLSYTHELARVRLMRGSVAGSRFEPVAEEKGLGDLTAFSFHRGAALYVQGGRLHRLAPVGAASTQLAAKLGDGLGIAGEHAFVVECGQKAKPDRLLQFPIEGGTPELVAELPNTDGHARCEYQELAADERSVYILDHTSLLGVSRTDRSVHTLLNKRGLLRSLLLEPDAVTLVASTGLLRLPRTGGSVERLLSADAAQGPFASVTAQGGEYWVHNFMAYDPNTTLSRMPRAGGTLKVFASFVDPAPLESLPGGESLYDFMVDDECVYLARERNGQGMRLLAKAK